MKKFEYKTTYVESTEPTSDNISPLTLTQNKAMLAEMNLLGKDGWELVQVIPNESSSYDTHSTRGGSWGSSDLKVPVATLKIKGYFFVWKKEI